MCYCCKLVNHVASQSKKAIKTREREAKEAARLVKEEEERVAKRSAEVERGKIIPDKA